jgi:eukaryotic-like serine/threonine-protein kinase
VAADGGDRTGQIVGGRYRIDALIGRGAMADVYRALDTSTSAYVALKILREALDAEPSAEQRFAREAEVQERIRHRNVAALLHTGVTDRNEPYLAVELLRGKTLRTVLKKDGTVEPRRAASYAWQALQGLAAVHALGILHRDLKPANIMLEPSPGPIDRVVLIDFGFASFEGSAKLTQAGTVVGSLQYIAPERLRGDVIDHRSDLYAIGMIFYELLTGRPPFTGNSDLELVDLHLRQPPPPLGPRFPAALDTVIQRALRKYPGERYRDADEMAAALEQAAAGL